MIDWAGRLIPYPADFVESYRSTGMWGSRAIGAELHEVAERRDAHPAVVAEEGVLSYHELDGLSDRLALGLSEIGLHPGDRVIVQLTNRLHSVVAWYGLLKAGLIPVCTLAAHRAHEIGAISRKVGAVAHLVEWTASGFDLVGFANEQLGQHPTLRHVLVAGGPTGCTGNRLDDLIEGSDPNVARTHVASVQAGIDADEIVCFQLSGGTTGVPKVIPRLHAEYWYNARVFAEASGWDENTRAAHLIPIIHNAGITCAMQAVHSAGGTLVLATAVLDQALPVIAQAGATDMLVGHGHFSMVDHPWFGAAMTSMKRVVLSGAKVPERVFTAFESEGVWVGQTFGMGEGFFTMSTPESSRTSRLTTVGVPCSALDELRVVAPETEDDLPDGAIGELVCRGPYTLRGYFDAPEVNSKSFTSDGFYRTGDLVSVKMIDGERSMSVEGRLKDLINRGGEKVSAEEVELLLLRHPRITAAAVVAMPDPRLGERACAFLVAHGEPLSMVEIQTHLDGQSLAKFKWPERLEWLSVLPKTPVGKIDKRALRDEIQAKVESGV